MAGVLVASLATVFTFSVHADADLAKQPSPVVAGAPPADGPHGSWAAGQVAANAAGKKRPGVMHGIASWYGGVFNGRTTASGEKFDMNQLTACHPTLPFGSIVRVINRRNKRSVVVRINDRGDLVDDRRVIDLSWAAAEKLAMTRNGLAKVDVEVLSLGGPSGGGR